METRVRAAAREIINGLRNAEDTQNIIKWLEAAKFLTRKHGQKDENLPSVLGQYSDVPSLQLQTTFQQQHFGKLCTTILDLLSVEWIQKLPGNLFSAHVGVLFLEGSGADALLALDHAVQSHR